MSVIKSPKMLLENVRSSYFCYKWTYAQFFLPILCTKHGFTIYNNAHKLREKSNFTGTVIGLFNNEKLARKISFFKTLRNFIMLQYLNLNTLND